MTVTRPRVAGDVLERLDARVAAAEVAAEVVEYSRKSLAAESEAERWLAVARAKDLSQVLQGLTSYVQMLERGME